VSPKVLEIDIIERKQAEERKIKRSESKYRKLYESMMDGFVLVSMEGMIKESNEAYQKMVGYTPEEIIEAEPTGILTPENGMPSSRRSSSSKF